ncbi:hypothetical protein RFI_04459 [Reticulomyxa filosa]|uniref:Uncharacterized protein n=1 Tax=Reticulomyxa filosa TaxID=46433 RepID=X6P3F4_RETFI|nr:hypothetical protein RFI_04459 [Reticulomyxa filosa]|eukprot:ETO32658.1 hypothetical protein RFI_04459 [Reticulomyxa filosa]
MDLKFYSNHAKTTSTLCSKKKTERQPKEALLKKKIDFICIFNFYFYLFFSSKGERLTLKSGKMTSTPRKKVGAMTMITNNSQPYTFSISLDTNESKILIQAKNQLTKDAFYGEFEAEQLRQIGFHQHVRGLQKKKIKRLKKKKIVYLGKKKKKGFYSRLKLALESKSPQELRAYYWFLKKDNEEPVEDIYANVFSSSYSLSKEGLMTSSGSGSGNHTNANNHNTNIGDVDSSNNNNVTTMESNATNKVDKKDSMALILEESNRYDEEASKWCLVLKQLNIKDTQKLGERLQDVVKVVGNREKKIQEQINFIIQQAKQKFETEKQNALKWNSALLLVNKPLKN